MFTIDQKTSTRIYKDVCKHFIKKVAKHMRNRREIDNNIYNIMVEIMKKEMKNDNSKQEVKNKTKDNKMPRNETQRRFKFEKEEFKGKNGRYLRIGVHKVTREVRRISPDNWTEEAKSKFYIKFPKLLDVVEKNKTPSRKETPVKKTPVKKTPVKKKKKINTTDLIASLVRDSRKQLNSSCENSPEAPKKSKSNSSKKTQKTEEQKTENIEKTIEKNIAQNMFANVTIRKKKKKKVKRNKNKVILPSNQLEVSEFIHKDIDYIAYIDKNNNIWNDSMKKIGSFDEEESSITMY